MRTTAITCLGLLLLALLLVRGCGGGREKTDAREQSPGQVSTLARFGEVLAEHAGKLDGSFRIPCTPGLHATLMEPSAANPKTDLLGEIRSMNGSSGCTMGWDGDTLVFESMSYYAGWRILAAVRNGHEDWLDARERETLRAARALVAGASGALSERERYIHDALCNRIGYYTNEETQEDKDCATGALLDGRADCDGYADAMMLCCGLADIPCRYMHGAARDPGEFAAARISKDAGHMWNLVEIAGRWVSVDATWGDQENRISYLSYNLGRKHASLAYRWDPRALPVELAEETDSETQLMPDQRRTAVRSPEEAYRAARQTTPGKVRRFTFVCPGTPPWQTAETEFHRMLARGGWKSYHHSQSGRMLEVTDIQTEDNVRFCDTEEDALDAIRDFAGAGVRSFSLYFSPALADALFADDRNGLQRLLSLSLLGEPGTFRFSPESGSVGLEDVSFTHPLPVCRSEREILSLLRRELAERPASLAFLLPDGFDFPTVQERVMESVYSLGLKRFSWSCVGNRVCLQRLEYHEEFHLVETRSDVAEYLRWARQNGKTELRIYCPPDLYAALKAENARAFWKLLEESGYGDCRLYSDGEAGMFLVEGR